VNAADHVAAIRNLMPKKLDGGDKKKQKIAVTPTAKEKDVSKGEGVSFVHSCALCGESCGDDHMGVSKSQPVEKGSVVFHKACREEIFTLKRWKGTCSKYATLSLSKNKQWQLIAAKANAGRVGVDSLTPATDSVPIKTPELSVAAIKSLAAEASLIGDEHTSNLYAGMAKLLQKNSNEASASAETLREFGIYHLLWDKKDLAIENAARRRGGRQAELIKKATIERDCFLWDLINSCSQDLTGTKDRSEWIDEAEKQRKLTILEDVGSVSCTRFLRACVV
jgi:hypothetical protein